jgi:hypothetical protein
VSLVFLQPWVWLLAAGVAVPVAVHFLARDRSRQVTFPTLRFLETTRLSAVRWRALQDWPLLAIRMAVVLAAVAALASPVFVTPGRQAAWRNQVARAVVLHDRATAADDELRSATAGAVFARDRVRDAVFDAVRWLDEQRPIQREIVVLSPFRRGAIAPADLLEVPPGVGVRLVRTALPAAVREREMARLQLRGDELVRVTEQVRVEPAATDVREVGTVAVSPSPILVDAPPAERARADAALRAVLRRGVRLPPAGLMQPLTIVWPGEVGALAAEIDARLAAPLDGWEPELMSDAELAAVSRPVAPDAEPAVEDMGDRRIFWVLVLFLLGLEGLVRKGGA